jgi:LysM repeat protein
LRYDTTTAVLVEMNGLTDADLLQVGQVIAVP